MENTLCIKNSQIDLDFEKNLEVEYFFEKERNSVKDYICYLCKGVYFEPYVDKCGHIFCRECIFKHLSKHCECPISKEKQIINDLTFIGLLSDLLNSKHIYCKNKNVGCNWTGALPEFQNHVNVLCDYEEVNCKNKGCPEKLFRSNLKIHLPNCDYRMIKCEFCSIDVAYNELFTHHQICPKFIIPCEQNCKEKIIREDMENHRKLFCIKTKINCPFKRFGCKEEIMRESIEDHLVKEIMMHQLMMLGYMNNKIDENENTKFDVNEFFPDLKMLFKNKNKEKIKEKNNYENKDNKDDEKFKYESNNMELEEKFNYKDNDKDKDKDLTDIIDYLEAEENYEKKENKSKDLYSPLDLKLFSNSNSLINLIVNEFNEKETLSKRLLGVKRKQSEHNQNLD
jgi:hypothetical protein